MRIGFVSDLHIDFNRQYDFCDILAKLVQDEQLDRLVIMGDSANGRQRNLNFYTRLTQKLPIPFNTLIGNHDLYVSHPRRRRVDSIQRESRQTYFQLDNLSTALTRHPILTIHWAITGINGWYDYTFAKNFKAQRVLSMRIILWPNTSGRIRCILMAIKSTINVIATGSPGKYSPGSTKLINCSSVPGNF
ncbi:metallophosphoesterase [Lentilactobacillus rapi]|uniref:metallophosphoesterase n=1 Tax=Lentilactobacillus rapi TaxID=481723 RepID=UPI001FB1AE6F|nr:metallophosphoesterase [Lentilactobacillus rapi]